MRRASIGFATLMLGLAAVFSYAQAPVPLINQPLVPDATAPGGPQFTLTINGTGFVSNSRVNWNTTPLATTFVSGSQLTAVVPASDIATASTGWVTVVNPAPGGGTSNTAFFTATPNVGNSVAFGLASSSATGVYPWSVVAGDFNGDGILDLAVANECGPSPSCQSAGTVSVLLGDGTGSFTLASSPEVGSLSQWLAAGDFNGDGKLDLAVADRGSQTVSILLGDGTGNFTLASSPVLGFNPYSVAAGDFNGDGKLDLAVAVCGIGPVCSTPGAVAILLGDGTGNFTTASSPDTGYNPSSVAVGDFNGDGILDLAVVNECGSDPNCLSGGTVSILLGDGTGNFTLASSPATGAYPVSVAAGDFNGDGILDLAVASGCGSPTCGGSLATVSILLGNGTGNFTLASTPTVGSGPLSVAAGDFNGDGNLDLAVANVYSDTVSILLGDGTGNFSLLSSPAGYPESVAVGDFNGDGKLDLAVANWASGYSSSVSILLQANPALTLSPTSLSFGTQLVGTTSSVQNVTLTSTGNATLDITSIAASANFSETNTCGTTLAAGATCTISVSFVPLGVGTLAGTITVTDNASNSPQTVSLTGVGTEATLSPAALNFNTQPVGTTSAPQTVTLTNHGYREITIAGIHLAGADSADFAQTNTCGTSVPAGSSCTISVTFTPQAKGSQRAMLGVSDNGGGAPQTVTLKGYGM